MNRDKKWHKLEDYIALKLREIDPFAKHTPGSGNGHKKGDIQNSVNLHIECKERATDSVTINNDVWNKLKAEIPLHVKKTPLLCLENKEGKRWAVLELSDFLNLYIELYKSKITD
ncbi:MAG: hypothetical protein AABY22_10795 [Nanoarchaeota archaeon]